MPHVFLLNLHTFFSFSSCITLANICRLVCKGVVRGDILALYLSVKALSFSVLNMSCFFLTFHAFILFIFHALIFNFQTKHGSSLKLRETFVVATMISGVDSLVPLPI